MDDSTEVDAEGSGTVIDATIDDNVIPDIGGDPLINPGVPRIKLKEYETTVKVGAAFNPFNYIKEAVDDKDDAWRRIYIEGNYTTKKPGEYVLKFSIRDTDGNKSNVEVFLLRVIELN